MFVAMEHYFQPHTHSFPAAKHHGRVRIHECHGAEQVSIDR
jgi:hypothetical protein